MISADSNIFIHAANRDAPKNEKAVAFIQSQATNDEFAICELVLIEIYMQLRNPAIMRKPLSAAQAHDYCQSLRANQAWQIIDYRPEVSPQLWTWAKATKAGFRRIIDARLAFTVLHHGVTEWATGNERDFEEFSFEKVFNPL